MADAAGNGPDVSKFTDRVFRTEAQVASHDSLDVRHFHVSERMQSIFEVNLVALSDNPDIDFEAVIGQPMRFVLHGGGKERTWSGLCSHLQQVRVEEDGRSTYELTLVPTLWLATQRRNFRMFQHLSELDIALQLLGEWGIKPTLRLAAQYKKRKYRLQYGESDYTFICRMLEDAGITFYFDNSGESGMVLDDGPQGNTARTPIAFRDRPTDAEFEHVTEVHVGRRLRPGKYTVYDHDYRRPASFKLAGSASASGPVEERLERFHYVPGAFLYESVRGESTPTADDQGKYRADEPEGEGLAQRRLEAQRSSARETTFKTNTVDPAPGMVLSFLDHPKTELGAGKMLLVVASTYEGDVPGHWVHACTAVSAETQYRPPLDTPKPRAQGVESATVVGPAGEEIHTDEFGRVRVHFHWDRESQMNQDSSCWIHVNQAWGGTGYGGSNLPRIGQEVIVDFLNADPDRPIITGRVYTNLQKTPYTLPANKTQSGWKSNSSPTNGGYNEIMFEDKAGAELVRMQAEKDLQKLVKHDQQTTVGNDRSTSIGNDESLLVGNDATKQVVNNLSEVVGMNRIRVVGVNEMVQIGEQISIVCGKSSFTMDKDGNITLSGVKIIIAGEDHIQAASAMIDLN